MPDEGPAPGPGVDAAAARRLLGYLRELARARRAPARDIAAHDQVHWLADLPGEVYVETEAGPGEVLFSIPFIPISPPGVLEEFDGWLAMRHWYRALRDLAERPAAEGGEAVLATGLLAWRPPRGPAVRGHLLSTPVRIALDRRSGRVDVVVAGPAVPRDRDLLAGVPGLRADGAGPVRDAARAGRATGLTASAAGVLREWCAAATGERDEPVAFQEDWAPADLDAPLPQAPRMRLAPALVVCPPGQAALVGHYDTLLARLGDGPVPAGLAAFLTPGGRSPLLNRPDATPEAIADMLAGMLAQGRRVLVAVPDGAAALRLRAALPDGIAGLCAAVTDPAPPPDAAPPAAPAGHAMPAAPGRRRSVPDQGPAAPDRIAAALLAHAAGYEPYRHRDQVAELAEREAALRTAVAGLAERARTMTATEAGTCDLGGGYRGEPAALDRRLRTESADHGWLPPRRDLPETAPLSAAEAAELIRLLAEETPERRARTAQRDVDPAALPSPPYVRTLIEAEATAVARARRSETETSRRLRACDVQLLARLDARAGTVNAALRELGLEGHPGGWDSADHVVRAFSDALGRRRPGVWAKVAEKSPQAEWAERALRSLAGHRVELPPDAPDPRRMAGAAQQLGRHLSDGGTLKRGPLRSSTQRQAEPLLEGVTVDGGPPVTPERLHVLFTHLMVRVACEDLQRAWEAAGVSFPADVPLESRVARFCGAHRRLARIRAAFPAVEETAELLVRTRLGIPLTHPVQWHGYTTALESALLGLGVNRATADLTALRDSIGAAGGDDAEPPPELIAALAAIDARDVGDYGRCLLGLAEARHERGLQARCDRLLGRVRAAHPELAGLMAATARDRAWAGRLERWDEAWAWARAAARIADVPRSAAETGLRADLEEAGERLRQVSGRLAAAQAWGMCLDRIDRAATEPADIVPAWIVPLWRVPDVLPPRPGAFDAVIVHGEHGAGAEALFLLWTAPRMVLAGRSGPDLPVPPGADRENPEAISGTFPPAGLEAVTPTAPLFRILRERFDPDRPATPASAPAPDPGPVPVEPAPAAEPAAAVERVEPVEPVEPVRAVEPVPAMESTRAEEPVAAEEPVRAEEPAAAGAQAGRSIATYKREELIDLVARLAVREPDLDDDRLVEVAGRLLGCPADEELLVGARLRFAVEHYRESLVD
ncbi:hypothetical protein GCM10023085_31250 [Actinomadura viridis]|uniref:Uncharacterized protein n=1 Tax=Actinomadura viridis TaxID=58110 RepID=A0A931GHF1_9ACTN|nr:hypothetical protein [Actinomadura viridis]MBG6086807.1 hypothetical protein [Actinomadura viridis]